MKCYSSKSIFVLTYSKISWNIAIYCSLLRFSPLFRRLFLWNKLVLSGYVWKLFPLFWVDQWLSSGIPKSLLDVYNLDTSCIHSVYGTSTDRWRKYFPYSFWSTNGIPDVNQVEIICIQSVYMLYTLRGRLVDEMLTEIFFINDLTFKDF